VENYFNYFTEIEEQFQKRRGSGLLLSTLDWALIETWKDAGIPLEAVLRGIDSAFDRYDQRPSKSKKVNSLAYCAQEVLAAAEDIKEAAVGAQREEKPGQTLGFEPTDVAAFFRRNAAQLEAAKLPQSGTISVQPIALESARSLRGLASDVETANKPHRLEDLERRMTVLEEKLFAVLLAATPDEEIVAVRAQADRELAPYRSKMPSAQIEQLQRQYVHKRLLEKYGVPRLSLFYM
jgi:adenine-specific DNA methylase